MKQFIETKSAEDLQIGDIFQHNNGVLWRVKDNTPDDILAIVTAEDCYRTKERVFTFGGQVELDVYTITL